MQLKNKSYFCPCNLPNVHRWVGTGIEDIKLRIKYHPTIRIKSYLAIIGVNQ
jgi:hypothetical protein